MACAPDIGLRAVVPSDLSAFLEHLRDPAARDMAAFTTFDPSDEATFLAHWTKLLGRPEITVRAVVCDGDVVGHVAAFPRLHRLEVGYWIGRRFWGRGLATAALAALLRRVPGRPVYARVAHDNTASIHVLEKCGFRLLAVERTFAYARREQIDELLYVRA